MSQNCDQCGQPSPRITVRFCSQKCRNKDWHTRNREKALKKAKEWRENNPEQAAKAKKEWKNKNRDRHRVNAKKWDAANQDKHKLYRQKYREKDVLHIRELKKNIQARRRSQTKSGDVSVAEWEAIKLAAKGRCHYCKRKRFLTQDHVIPLSRGGEHRASNIAPACRSCNAKKHAKIITLL